MTLPLWLGNLAAYFLQVTVLVSAVSLLMILLRLRAARFQLACWQLVLVLCLLLPILQARKIVMRETPIALAGPGVQVVVTLADESAQPYFSWLRVLPWLLAGGIVLRILWLLLGLLRVRYYRRHGHRLDPLPEYWTELQRSLGVDPPVYLSRRLTGPATFGFRHPVILLPERFLQLDPRQQRAIACHELWHVRRKDYLAMLVEEMLAAALWFHPAAWWLLNRIQLCREQVIDRLVLETTRERKPYLEALLRVALSLEHGGPSLAPLFLSRSHLSQRVAFLLKGGKMSKSRLYFSVCLLAGFLLMTGKLAVQFFPLMSAQPLLAASESSSSSTSSDKSTLKVDSQTLSAKLIHQVQPIYPLEAKEKGIEGAVQFEVTIDEDGQVVGVQVVSGNAMLVSAAYEAVRQWRYEPFLLDGKPVQVKATVTVNFALEKKAQTGVPATPSGPPDLGPASGQASKLTDAMTKPKVLSRVEPSYTQEARDAKLQGYVVLEMDLSTEGKPQNVRVTKGLGKGLDEAAIQALQQWRFEPASLNGKPVAVHLNVEVNFQLQ